MSQDEVSVNEVKEAGKIVQTESICAKAQRQEGAWPSKDLKEGAGWRKRVSEQRHGSWQASRCLESPCGPPRLKEQVPSQQS